MTRVIELLFAKWYIPHRKKSDYSLAEVFSYCNVPVRFSAALNQSLKDRTSIDSVNHMRELYHA